MKNIVLSIAPDGDITCLHTEALPLEHFGHIEAKRASNIEFNGDTQLWEVRLMGARDPVFSHPSRAMCVAWEVETLNAKLAAGEDIMPRHALSC